MSAISGVMPRARKVSPWSGLASVRMRMPSQSAGARIGRTELDRWRMPLHQ